jgi:hypothetical protein
LCYALAIFITAIAAEMLLLPRPLKKQQPLVTLQKLVLKYTDTGFGVGKFLETSIILLGPEKTSQISVSNCKKKIYTLFQIAKCGQTS